MELFRFNVFHFVGVVAAVGFGSGAAIASGAAARTDAYPMSEWRVETVVSSWNVGPHLSVGTDTITGETLISFYDRVEGDLYLARTGGPGPGDCGPGNSWTCHLLDSEGDVGQYSSIAVDSGGQSIGFWISYFDATQAALKVVEGYVSRTTGELIVTVAVTVDSGNPGTSLYKGKHIDAAVDSLGLPRIAYQ